MSEAVIALGSNLGNRIENINAAVRAIARLSEVKIIKASSVYETDPVGCDSDEKYLNAAILVGWRVGGFFGMLTAVLGTVIPPIAIISVISLVYSAFATNPYVALVLKGMQAGVAAVSQSSLIINFAVMVCLGVSNAGQVLVSQALGSGKKKQLNNIIGTLFTLLISFSQNIRFHLTFQLIFPFSSAIVQAAE